jgi:hypothetical protein
MAVLEERLLGEGHLYGSVRRKTFVGRDICIRVLGERLLWGEGLFEEMHLGGGFWMGGWMGGWM